MKTKRIFLCYSTQINVTPDNKRICIYEYYNIDLVEPDRIPEILENPNMYTMHQFSFDHVYDQDSTQLEVYENTAQPAVLSTLQV
jgi:kinesin family protein 3/17